MVSPAVAGAVVLVRFPFSDLSASKLRDDWILCQITGNAYSDSRAIEPTFRTSIAK
uniref:Uncharacterized protein n=1 Tax=Candidatus Kentrum sp. FM TaxID=2126340 RepID=A0A450TUE1_9GAMM|nr:MAG: hypothetical protein BECKFM1743A_GA0114220_106114 [Candidatus Kentron sp. FM]VFJ72416.1 MAG: hypothetical protein BECKFM1743C_GA0114222_106524 [Candidatus Kentron sp. FM]VFK19437.1 MAG: hypothetical protein BECKFM1743B_GA0114221_106195 [Candidatus Kentron sp. FM]